MYGMCSDVAHWSKHRLTGKRKSLWVIIANVQKSDTNA